ncbi:tRNA glutamyl-Q(34) synthetase GluQRS [Vibrio pectenicida]|uniref:tRNA glutamyl-Q(34) synthetase GluQRS n=1 Tax=Vibrio pectenicida TaxID=62763 RepID=UPI003B9BD23C
MTYIGRFAPSPSGPLHFGSLVAALGSYFQAKSQQGKWLVRIEDLDPPREVFGAADLILRTLEAYHLYWDGEVIYQSQRHSLYQAQLEYWLASKQAYYCQCTRKQVKIMGGYYDGTCRHRTINDINNCAIRLVMTHPVELFIDRKHGQLNIPSQLAHEDFIVKRRDGLFAYNLAVVIDDIAQGITEVVRGADLIEPTGRQISLYHILNQQPIDYIHLPLALDNHGQKLSKQNHAPSLNPDHPKSALISAMRFLGFEINKEIEQCSVSEIIDWGIANWSIEKVPDTTEVTPRFSNSSL